MDISMLRNGARSVLDLEFKRLLAYATGSEGHEIRKLHSQLKRCWNWLGIEKSLFRLFVLRHLSKQERTISQYLKKVTE